MTQEEHTHDWRPGSGTVKDGRVSIITSWYCDCGARVDSPAGKDIPNPERAWRKSRGTHPR